MNVILLEKIRNVGSVGDMVSVKNGFGRNYLVPQGKALYATEENKKVFESKRAELEKRAKEELDAAKKRALSFENVEITISTRCSEEGNLYGSIASVDVLKGLQDKGLVIERHEIEMPEGPIKELGEHLVNLNLHSDVVVSIKVIVEPEEGHNS